MRAQGLDIATDMNSTDSERHILVQQNIDLRRKLEEEHQNYKRKLSNYQEGQQKQAELVQKLQQKVSRSPVAMEGPTGGFARAGPAVQESMHGIGIDDGTAQGGDGSLAAHG